MIKHTYIVFSYIYIILTLKLLKELKNQRLALHQFLCLEQLVPQ